MNLPPLSWLAVALTALLGAAGLALLLLRWWLRGPRDAVMTRASSGQWTVPVPRGDVPARFGADFLTQCTHPSGGDGEPGAAA